MLVDTTLSYLQRFGRFRREDLSSPSHATTARWVALGDRFGDRMNKDFFAAQRERSSGTILSAVLDDQGLLETHPDRDLDIATTYFEDLFNADPVTLEVEDARDTVWSHTRRSATAEMARSLCSGFTVQELREAVDVLDPASCPGDDGLTRQFFITHWDAISGVLLRGL